MADDNFFSGLQSGLSDLLPNKITYATPQQIEAIRGAGKEMYTNNQKPGVYTWGNAFGDIASKMMGGYMMSRAGELQKMGLEKGAEAVSSYNPSGDSSPTGGENSAPRPTSPNQGGAPTVNAADISTRLETGKTDPMQGLGSISPDTNGSKSYGNFGLNSQPGYGAHQFRDAYGDQLGLTATPGTPEFDAQWANLAKANPAALRQAEVDWYGKNVSSGVPGKLEKVGVTPDVAADPRVTAYFSDRVVQQGPGSITSAKHGARIQAAYQASGGDPVKFLKSMSLADRTPEALQSDFPHALKSGVYSQRGNDNRVMGREALSLGLAMPTPGAGGGALGAPSSAAIVPMVNAISGPRGERPQTVMPGASMAEPAAAGPGAAAQTAPQTLSGALKTMGVPGPSMSPTGALAPMVSAIGGAPQAPGAPPPAAVPSAGTPGPTAMTRAIAGPTGAPTGGGGPDIPPTLPMSALPDQKKIAAGLSSNIPQNVEIAKEQSEYRMKQLTPQQISTPDGSMYIGTPYTGYRKMGVQGMPQFIKSPFKVPGAYEGEQLSTLGQTPGGGFALNPVPTLAPGGQAGPGAAPGGVPVSPAAAASGVPPMPSTSDVSAMANWGTQVSAGRKAAEATAEETAKGAAKPMTEAMERASTAPDMVRKLDIMANAYKQGGMSGGPLGPLFHEMRGAAAQLGLIDPKDKTLTAQNIIDKIGTQIAFQATKELTTRPAASEVTMQLKANPGLMMNNQSALYMIDLMKQTTLQDQKVGQLAMQPGMSPSRFAEMRDKLYRDEPLISPFTHRPINEKGGGIPGTKNGPPPQAPGTPPPGASAGAPGPSPGAIAALRSNPALRDQFDAKYGPGSAAANLGMPGTKSWPQPSPADIRFLKESPDLHDRFDSVYGPGSAAANLGK